MPKPIRPGALGGLAAAVLAAPAWAQEPDRIPSSWHNFLTPMGPIAQAQLTELFWASLLIFVAIAPVLIATPWVFWRYRRDNHKASYRPDWGFSHRLELLQWGIPTLIVIALSVWLAQAVYMLDPYREFDEAMAAELDTELAGPVVPIDVIGLDWKWLFVYPEAGIASVGEMVVPVNHPVQMRLTTDTVMQSFMAPGVAGQIYTMAGMRTKMSFLADREGTTQILNTQYNGPGFAGQRSPLRSVSQDAYEAWLDEARSAPALDEETYAILAMSGTLAEAKADLGRDTDAPLMFTLPDDLRLFDRVLLRYMAGVAVAPENQPGSPVYDPEGATLPDLPPDMSLQDAMHGGHGGGGHGGAGDAEAAGSPDTGATLAPSATEAGLIELAQLRRDGAEICRSDATDIAMEVPE